MPKAYQPPKLTDEGLRRTLASLLGLQTECPDPEQFFTEAAIGNRVEDGSFDGTKGSRRDEDHKLSMYLHEAFKRNYLESVKLLRPYPRESKTNLVASVGYRLRQEKLPEVRQLVARGRK